MFPERYTLYEAADLLEYYAGERAGAMQDKLCKAAFDRELPVYMPGENARHRHYDRTENNIHFSYSNSPGLPGGISYVIRDWREVVKPFSEEAYWDDLNKWLDTNEPRIPWRFPSPDSLGTNPREQSDQLSEEDCLHALEKEGSKTGSNLGITSNPCEVFRHMVNLTAEELSIAFVGDKGEAGIGANNMLEISARGETRRVPLAALDLVNRITGHLNSQGAILLGMAKKQKLLRTDPNAAKMARLRKVLLKHLNIKSNPFQPYRVSAGWQPYFKITDKRGALEERARKRAELRTISLEGDIDETSSPFAQEDDAGGKWLQDNDSDMSS